MMFPDPTYKRAFICAVILHFLLLFFLCVKLATKQQRYTTNLAAVNVIEAVFVGKSAPPITALPKAVSLPTPAPKLLLPLKAVTNTTTTLSTEKTKIAKLAAAKTVSVKKLPPTSTSVTDNFEKEIQKEKRNLAEQMQRENLQRKLTQEIGVEKQNLTKVSQSVATMQQASGGAAPGEIDKYKALILQAIASNWVVPEGVDKNAACVLLVHVAPQGAVMDVKILQSSGNSVLDSSAEAAVMKASPLPVPFDTFVFSAFREIKLHVRPEGVNY